MKLAFFYDQSLIVRDSVRSVWEAIGFGLLLSVLIIYAFLRTWGTTLVATLVIPVTILITLVVHAARGADVQPDDARRHRGGGRPGHRRCDRRRRGDSRQDDGRPAAARRPCSRASARSSARSSGSTLTPVVVFIPLAFLDGITGVFFRALALTMVSSLLTSLLLAVTLTPALALWFTRGRPQARRDRRAPAVMAPCCGCSGIVYEAALRAALRRWWLTLVALCRRAGGCRRPLRAPPDGLPAADGRGRFRHRLPDPSGHEPVGDEPGTAAGRGDPQGDAGGGELLAAHRRAPRARDRRAEHGRLPREAAPEPAAIDRRGHLRCCGPDSPRRFPACSGISRAS